MKPTSFNTTPQRHYCQIILVLSSDEAIENRIIAERKVYLLMSFILLCWMNDWIRGWIWPNEKAGIKENRLIMLIGWLYDKGVVFDGSCFSTTIAKLLLEKNTLTSIKSVKSIKNYFSYSSKIPNIVQEEAQCIYSLIFERVPKKGPK